MEWGKVFSEGWGGVVHYEAARGKELNAVVVGVALPRNLVQMEDHLQERC